MQIKIEIDVKPEELRRFLGLPDVAGLQEDLIQFLRGKVGAASENFDPATFVKGNIDLLRNSAAWRTIVSAAAKAKPGGHVDADAASAKTVKRRPGAGASAGTAGARKVRASRNKTA
jgi:hypothetical protein